MYVANYVDNPQLNSSTKLVEGKVRSSNFTRQISAERSEHGVDIHTVTREISRFIPENLRIL